MRPDSCQIVSYLLIYSLIVYVADAGSALLPTAVQQNGPNIDTLGSSLAPLPVDSRNLVTFLPGDAATASPLTLHAATLNHAFAGSLCHTQQTQQIDFRSAAGSVTTCLRFATKSSSSGPDFYRLRRLLRRAKRSAAAAAGGREDADGKEDEDGDGCVGRYPLYCIVCRVWLNAQQQAKQHYKGRSHARRVRLLYGAPAMTAGTASDPAFNASSSNSSDAAEVSSVNFVSWLF